MRKTFFLAVVSLSTCAASLGEKSLAVTMSDSYNTRAGWQTPEPKFHASSEWLFLLLHFQTSLCFAKFKSCVLHFFTDSLTFFP